MLVYIEAVEASHTGGMHAQAHPDVPVVENMEDLWKVSKLQRERKRRQERIDALKESSAAKSGSHDAAMLKAKTINVDVVSSLSRRPVHVFPAECAHTYVHNGRYLIQKLYRLR